MPLHTLLIAPLALYASTAVEPPRFDAFRFFTGVTAGSGRLTSPLTHATDVRVHATGYVAENGTLVIDQQVSEGRDPPTRHIWQLRETGPGRYEGTLSDARGPVTGESFGDRLHLSYRGKGGTHVDQWMVMAQDGRSAQTLLIAEANGVKVAELQQTIRKMD